VGHSKKQRAMMIADMRGRRLAPIVLL